LGLEQDRHDPTQQWQTHTQLWRMLSPKGHQPKGPRLVEGEWRAQPVHGRRQAMASDEATASGVERAIAAPSVGGPVA
jgi:hypothetical protein